MSRTISIIILVIAIFVLVGVLSLVALLVGRSYFVIADQSTTMATPAPVLEVTVAATGRSSTVAPDPTAVQVAANNFAASSAGRRPGVPGG
jgi:hypothetical protein